MDNTNFMLFKWVNDKGEHEDIYVLNPILKSFKEFNPDREQDKLSDLQMRFVILCADPFSPLILVSGKEQKKMAAKLLSMDKEYSVNTIEKLVNGNVIKIENAIKFYQTELAEPKYFRYKNMREAMISQLQSILDTLNHRQNNEIVDENGKKRKKTPEDYLRLQEQCNKTIKDKLDKIILDAIDEYEEKMDMYKIDIAKWGIELKEEDISIDSIKTKDL